MAVTTLDKIRLVVHHSQTTSVLSRLQKLGVIELTEVLPEELLTKREQGSFQYNRESSRLDFVVEYLGKYSTHASGLKSVFEGEVKHVREESLQKLNETFQYNEIIDRVQELEKKLNTVRSAQNELTDRERLLLPWIDLNISIDNGLKTRETETLLVSNKNLDEGLRELVSNSVPYHHEIVSPGAHAIVVLNEDVERTRDIFSRAHVEVVALPYLVGTVSEALKEIQAELKEHSRTETLALAELETIANSRLGDLKIMSDIMLWKKEEQEHVGSAFGTNETALFEGWIPQQRRQEVEDDISRITNLFAIENAVIGENEEPPVLLTNTGIARPFETITKLYGVPGYAELDPTPFLAPFFFIFFGLCLTDVGYGVTLALITALILTFFRVEKGLKQMLQLLMLGGIGAATIGLFFGGYLGIDPRILPEGLVALQYFDPIATPIPVLFLALGLGVAQIMFGIFLKIFREAKNGSLGKGLLDQVPWLLFFTSIILIGLHAFGMIKGVGEYYTYFFYAAVLSLVLTQGRAEKGFLMKGFKGVTSLYDSVAYFSDILSYSRLLALGLATTALAFSINLIAVLLGEMIPVVGGAVTIGILIVGHVFNLGVNVLGAFIHSARLQFVEFFGKFVMSTGKDFRAFERTRRYVATRE